MSTTAAELKTNALPSEDVQGLLDELKELDASSAELVWQLGAMEKRRAEIQALMRGETPDITEVSPEQVNEAINALKAQFDKTPEQKAQEGYKVQEGLDWSTIEAKLRALETTDDTLIGLYNSAVVDNARPDVVCEEDGKCCLLETFERTLEVRANCVYNRLAQRSVGRKNCNGNAVDQSRTRKIPLAEKRIASAHLVRFPDPDQFCYDWLQVAEGRYSDTVGDAPCAYRSRGKADVYSLNAHYLSSNLGWRGAVWF